MKDRQLKRGVRSRIDGSSTFFRRIVPALLAIMAALTVALILVAVGVLLRIIPFQ